MLTHSRSLNLKPSVNQHVEAGKVLRLQMYPPPHNGGLVVPCTQLYALLPPKIKAPFTLS